MHVTSLPSRFGIGDFGPEAYHFVDFLSEASQSYWQVLPFNPTGFGVWGSPYSSLSAFANNTFLISPEMMVQNGILKRSFIDAVPDFSVEQNIISFKESLLADVGRHLRGRSLDAGYDEFSERERFWLDDFALFVALKEHFGGRPWFAWPEEFKRRDPAVLARFAKLNADKVRFVQLSQYLLTSNGHSLRPTPGEKGFSL